MMIKLTKSCREAGSIYAEALVEACAIATPPRGSGPADPVRVITDTDEYPWVTKKIEQAEFIVGWFHGVAEACGVLPEVAWETFVPPEPVHAPAPKGTKSKTVTPKAVKPQVPARRARKAPASKPVR